MTLPELLEQLRAAQTPADYDRVTAALRELQADIGEIRTRMESAEEAAIFSGDDFATPRATVRQCDDELRTIEIALAGAERRRAEVAVRDDAEQLAALANTLDADSTKLRALFTAAHTHLAAARQAIFEAHALSTRMEGKNATMIGVGRRDLTRNVNTIRRESMDHDLPSAPLGIPRTLRDADKVILAVATGKRPWHPASAGAAPHPDAQPNQTPAEAVKPLRRPIAA